MTDYHQAAGVFGNEPLYISFEPLRLQHLSYRSITFEWEKKENRV